jgi:hypothetical protein
MIITPTRFSQHFDTSHFLGPAAEKEKQVEGNVHTLFYSIELQKRVDFYVPLTFAFLVLTALFGIVSGICSRDFGKSSVGFIVFISLTSLSLVSVCVTSFICCSAVRKLT